MTTKLLLLLLLLVAATAAAAQPADSILVDANALRQYIEKAKNKNIVVILKNGKKYSGKVEISGDHALFVDDAKFISVSHGYKHEISERIEFDQIARLEPAGRGPPGLMIATLITFAIFLIIGSARGS